MGVLLVLAIPVVLIVVLVWALDRRQRDVQSPDQWRSERDATTSASRDAARHEPGSGGMGDGNFGP